MRKLLLSSAGLFTSVVLVVSGSSAVYQEWEEESFPRFENITEQAGLEFTLLSGSVDKRYILESMSGGVGFIDFNNDGWLDIYLVNGSTLEAEREGSNKTKNRLFRNNRDGTFTDVTENAGVGDTGWGMGVCVGDVNNNGWEDLYVTNFGANVLYVNNGDGTFEDISRKSGTDDSSWSSSCGFADFDKDGNLDLYVSNYLHFDLDDPPRDSPICEYRGIPVQCGPRGLTPQGDRFFKNVGNGVFVDRTEQSGVGRATRSYGMGVIWTDFNGDGFPDVFVANDSTPNFLFRNNGDETFTGVALQAGVALNEDGSEQAGMGVDFGDFDNDGYFDLIVTNFSEDTHTLYQNHGDGFFSDVTSQANLGKVTWPLLGWGVAFIDLDLDGWKDLVIAHGHIYPEVDRAPLGTSYRQRNLVLRNLRDGRFQDIQAHAGTGFAEIRNSRGLAYGDINNDGQLDLLIANLDESPSLLLNRGVQGNWIILKLKGTESNRSAIGARVSIEAGDLKQVGEVRSGGSYQSQNDLRLHFGLGSAATVDRLEVHWPVGAVEVFQDLPGNQILVIEQGASLRGGVRKDRPARALVRAHAGAVSQSLSPRR